MRPISYRGYQIQLAKPRRITDRTRRLEVVHSTWDSKVALSLPFHYQDTGQVFRAMGLAKLYIDSIREKQLQEYWHGQWKAFVKQMPQLTRHECKTNRTNR